MSDVPGAGAHDAGVTPADLDRERLRTYVDWAEVRAPAWYWPGYAAAIAVWIAAYDLGPLWGTAGALGACVVFGLLIRAVTRRSGVSFPRFRGMPAPLLRSFLPPLVVGGLGLLAVLGALARLDDPPFVLLGPAIGVGLALAGAWSSVLYRRAARRLAREAGLADG